MSTPTLSINDLPVGLGTGRIPDGTSLLLPEAASRIGYDNTEPALVPGDENLQAAIDSICDGQVAQVYILNTALAAVEGNQYPTFAELYSALSTAKAALTAPGTKKYTILFCQSATIPALIGYNFDDVEWVGPPSNPGTVTVTVADGAVATRVPARIGDGLVVEFNNGATAFWNASATSAMRVDTGASLTTTGASAPFRAAPGGSLLDIEVVGASILTGTVEVFNADDAAANWSLDLSEGAVVQDNTIASVGGASFPIRRLDTGCSYGLTQAGLNDATALDNGPGISVASNDASGTPGAVTIDRPAGRAAIALGASSVVVTNNLVTAASHVFVSMGAVDATVCGLVVVAGAGSFTVTGIDAVTGANAAVAATANLPFDFLVINP